MCDPETGNWITFNGEIYNYQALRQELQHYGCVFQSQTDTEVILKAFAVWGLDSISRLRGIFAFGLWDQHEQRLVLARDQLGVKPLYYWQHKDVLLFASEVRALLASELIPRQLDVRGLRSYLAYGSVQEPYTLVQGISSLLPGHILTWQKGHTQTRRYWQLPTPGAVQERSLNVVLDEVQQHLQTAVAAQLMADVPLGAFLSGGIDSTAVAALMKQCDEGAVKTFSVIFEEKQYDERYYAQIAARYIGTEHTELLLRGEDVQQSLSAALGAFDQPSVDGLNTYFVSKVTREAGLTVALSGLGGDELFGGYSGYQKSLLLETWGERLQLFPRWLRNSGAYLLAPISYNEMARRFVGLLQTRHHPYFLARQVYSQQQIDNLLMSDMSTASRHWEPDLFQLMTQETSGYDRINRQSALEMQTYMLSTLLRDTDQMSMAHALEVRVPLIDHVLVEYLFSVPGDFKVDATQPKPLLTRSLNDAIPDECIYRPKRGFELPFAVWLQESLQDKMQESFLGQSTQTSAPFEQRSLEQTWKLFQQGRLSWSRIWSLFTLRTWLDTHGVTS
jgi:asparagine synthase (glutamine-hydrolysing)